MSWGLPQEIVDAIVAGYAAGEPVMSLAARFQMAPGQIEAIVAQDVAHPSAPPGYPVAYPGEPAAYPGGAPGYAPPSYPVAPPSWAAPAYPGPYPSAYQPGNPVAPVSGPAVIALVMGIVTVVGGFLLLVPIVLTAVFAFVGYNETQPGAKSGRGLILAAAALAVVGMGELFLTALWYLLA